MHEATREWLPHIGRMNGLQDRQFSKERTRHQVFRPALKAAGNVVAVVRRRAVVASQGAFIHVYAHSRIQDILAPRESTVESFEKRHACTVSLALVHDAGLMLRAFPAI
jgi:hypothetical protein